jgi:hypothetical protein
MKTFILALSLFIGQAHAWETVLECDNRALVIDEQCSGYRYVPCYTVQRQVVINDPGIVHFLQDTGSLESNYGERYINSTNVNRNNSEGSSFSLKTYAPAGDVMMNFTRKGRGLLLEAYLYQEVNLGRGTHIELKKKLAEWFFQNCQ